MPKYNNQAEGVTVQQTNPFNVNVPKFAVGNLKNILLVPSPTKKQITIMRDNVSVVICDAAIRDSVSVSTIYWSSSAVFSWLISMNYCMPDKTFGKSFHAALPIPAVRLVAAIMDHITNNQ